MPVRPCDPMKSGRRRLGQALAAAVLAAVTAAIAVRAWQLVAGFVRGVAGLLRSLFA